MSRFLQVIRLMIAIVVATPLVLIIVPLVLVECIVGMVSEALIRLGISILVNLSR